MVEKGRESGGGSVTDYERLFAALNELRRELQATQEERRRHVDEELHKIRLCIARQDRRLRNDLAPFLQANTGRTWAIGALVGFLFLVSAMGGTILAAISLIRGEI